MPAVTPGVPRTSNSVTDLIGNTPLIRLSSFEQGLNNVQLWAKAEWRNPGGSVKDRPAARMIADEAPGRDFRHAAFVPESELNRAFAEGWFHDPKAWKRWANDPANACSRTLKGWL